MCKIVVVEEGREPIIAINAGITGCQIHVGGVLYHRSQKVAPSEFVPVGAALRPL